ncbi:hypothetical protein [Holdemania massiliensis]|uniref:hypothetical protein n=1 Tax=Holdemania massiliensis TaxID=1468449 RepID=UPI001F0691EA|nr:hypothetical protein [Holdemania massiliensis]MCH1939871.1 hypothetical protein [Holdemania massiliensis]
MVKIANIEGNLEFKICLKRNDMLDYNPQRSDYENWIPFTLYLNLPDRCSIIGENVKATMTIFEIKNLIHGIENVLVHLDNQETVFIRLIAVNAYLN